MSESTLQTTWTELETEVGRYLGWDRTITNWSADQQNDAIAICKRGLRQFYFPPKNSPNELVHIWSFLRPKAQLTIWDDVIADDAITVSSASYDGTVTTITASDDVFYETMEEKSLAFDENSNTYVIDEYVSATQVKVTGDASGETGNTITIDSEDTFTLPWDFGGVAGDGKFTFINAENKLSFITLTSDTRIRLLRQHSISAGTPYLFSVSPMRTDGTQGQRWELLVHPPPNDNLTVEYRYYIKPNALLDTSNEYPYGSVEHSETIIESCLAIAEAREKDSSKTDHQERFAILLAASVERDKRLGESINNYGYNRDHSDDYDYRLRDSDYFRHNSLITFNGVAYEAS